MDVKEEYRRLHVTLPEDDGQRVDVVLGRRLPGLSRRMARRMALDGHVRVEGKRAAPSTRVHRGHVVEVVWRAVDDADGPSISPLQTTEDFVFVQKPAGLHTHRLRPDQPPSLADYVATLFPECASASPDPREGGAVHRLDLETSGVVVFARSRSAWTAAREAFAGCRVRKRYLAIVHADGPWPPPEPPDWPGTVEPDAASSGAVWVCAPIGRGARRDRAAVTPRGPSARTRIHVLARAPGEPYALVDLTLVTGRRHQARLHLAFVGHPIVGDAKYGRADDNLPLMLHAAAIDLSPLAPPVSCPPSVAFCDFLAARGIDLPAGFDRH